MHRIALYLLALVTPLSQIFAAVGEILEFEGSAPTDSYQLVYHKNQAVTRQENRLLVAVGDGTWQVILESESPLRELVASAHRILVTTDARQSIAGTVHHNGTWRFQTHSHPELLPFSISAGENHFVALANVGDEDFPENAAYYTTDGSDWQRCEIDDSIFKVFATPVGFFAATWSFSQGVSLYKAASPDRNWQPLDNPPDTGPIIDLQYNPAKEILLATDSDFYANASTDGGDSWQPIRGIAAQFSQTVYRITAVGDQFIATGDATYLSQYGHEWKQIPSGYYTPLAFAADSDGQIQTFAQAGSAVSHFSLGRLLGELYEVSNEEALSYFAQTEPGPPENNDDNTPSIPETRSFPTGNLTAVSEYQTLRSPSSRISELIPHRGGILVATYQYARNLKDGSGGVEQDLELSNSLYFAAGYLKSHYTAQAELGFIYQNGRGNLAADPVQALSFFTMAAKNGDPSAQLQLGYLYDSGDHNFPVDLAKTREYFEQAAASGNRIALANLAHLHDKGIGVEKNHRLAGAYYLKILDGQFVYRPHHYDYGPAEWLLDRETTERIIGRDLEEMASIHTYHIVKAAAEEGAPYAADLFAIILTRAFGCLSDHVLAHQYHAIAKERGETIYNDAWFDKNAHLRSATDSPDSSPQK